MRARDIVVLTLTFGIVGTSVEAQKRYPTWGSVNYGGSQQVSFWMMWEIPGSWTVADPGYEHNLSIRPQYYDVCTSYTDLPYAYDDCPTTGVSEETPEVVFAFGSYHIVVDQCCNTFSRHSGYHPPYYEPPIVANSWYYGEISMSCSTITACPWYSTDWHVYAQEVDRIPSCQSDNVLCMFGTTYGGANGLVTGQWTINEPKILEYRYDPVSGELLYIREG